MMAFVIVVTEAIVIPKVHHLKEVLDNMKDDGAIALAGLESVGQDIKSDVESGKAPKPLTDIMKGMKNI